MIPLSRQGGLCLGIALLPVALIAQTVSVTVTSTEARNHLTAPLPLGFNLEWDGVQHYPYDVSNLWDGTNPTTDIVKYLKNDFAGAIYRYPGGMGANFEWQKSVGPVSGRAVQYNSTAGQDQVVKFGFDEAMKFLEAVGGRMLPVVNIYRMEGQVITTEAQWDELMIRQLGWLEYANAPAEQVTANDWNGDGYYQGKDRANNGHPAPYNVTMWELGNEMDHGATMDYQTFTTRCNELMSVMLAAQPNLKILVAGRTSPWGPTALCNPQPPISAGASAASWRDWHNAFLPTLGPHIWAISEHSYYDGISTPWAHNFITTTYNDFAAWAAGKGLPDPKVAITENAVHVDPNTPSLWPRTTALRSDNPFKCGGAIDVIDFAIIQHAYNKTRMLITHELACKGPWALFNEVNANGYIVNAGVFKERPLAHSLKLLNSISKDADVLDAGNPSSTPNASGYGYDVRAMGYRHGPAATGIHGALLINRADVSYPLNLKLPNWAAGSQVVRIKAIGGQDETQLWTRYISADVANNQATLKLPACSVFNAVALGANLAMNADFETGASGSAPASWEKRINSGLAGTANRTADATTAVNGANIVRLETTAANSGLSLVQPDWFNPALNSTGLMSANLNDTYILRANVRTSGTVGAKVRTRMQIFNTAGYVTSSPMSVAAPEDTAGKWVPLEVEFVPATILAGTTFSRAEIVLSNDSSAGYAEFDGVTLFRRQNTARNPNLLDAVLPLDNAADSWECRKDGTATITYFGTATPKYVRLSKTSPNTNQFCQNHNATSVLASRLNEKWRLRARVRYQDLDTSGAHLKVQFFAKKDPVTPTTPTSYLGAFPQVTPTAPLLLTQTNPASASGWVETVLEFNPRELIGSATFDYAEIMLQNNSKTGYIDVSYISLEAVD